MREVNDVKIIRPIATAPRLRRGMLFHRKDTVIGPETFIVAEIGTDCYRMVSLRDGTMMNDKNPHGATVGYLCKAYNLEFFGYAEISVS